ncbi:sensor histidine kinase [Gottfriedia luciferensis]|uniref:sensor histidine kinase n=1 Tax=Gottfriedia luciferensis TaxID=178774 RepID=UPI000B42E614|nr:histidine kinase [Gottfriedia luciferensis]
MKNSIRSKLIVLLLIATIIPFGLSIIASYFYTKNTVTKEFVNTNHDLLERSGNDLLNYFNEIRGIPLSIYSNRPFLSVLENGASTYIEQNSAEINRSLLGLYFSRREIEQLHLYLTKGKDDYTVYNAKVSSRGKLYNFNKIRAYRNLSYSRNSYYIEPTHAIQNYNNLSDFRVEPVKQVVSLHYFLNNVTSDQWLGFLSIDIELGRIKEIFDRIYKKGEEHLFVVGDGNVVLYSSEKKLIGTKLKTKWYEKISSDKSGETSFDWKDKDFSGVYVYDKINSNHQQWTIIKSIPYKNLYHNSNQLLKITVTLGAISVLLVIILTIIVSFRFTRPIRILIRDMQRIEKGELAVSFDSLGNDEFGQLGKHFTSMVDTLNELYIKEYKLQIENKTNQLKVLQSQVNPHFLYNALQSIGTLSLKNDGIKVYRLIMSLSKIMRYSMKNNEDFVTLKDELNHINDYLILQNERYDGKFEYNLDVEKGLEKVIMPKMILQPIVENFFKHGFEKQQKLGALNITIKRQPDYTLKITIADNGEGVSKEELEQITSSLLVEGLNTQESIGLKNISDRIQFYYGKKAQLKIDSVKYENFVVSIILPIEMTRGEINHESFTDR